MQASKEVDKTILSLRNLYSEVPPKFKFGSAEDQFIGDFIQRLSEFKVGARVGGRLLVSEGDTRIERHLLSEKVFTEAFTNEKKLDRGFLEELVKSTMIFFERNHFGEHTGIANLIDTIREKTGFKEDFVELKKTRISRMRSEG